MAITIQEIKSRLAARTNIRSGKILVSVSGGKDSTATLLYAVMLHGVDNVVAAFADTGNEHPLTLGYVDYLEKTIGVPITRLKADLKDRWWHRRDYVRDVWPRTLVRRDKIDISKVDSIVLRVLQVLEAGPTGIPFLDLAIIKGRFPSRTMQFCTEVLKIEPLTEYALGLRDEHGAVESWQGVRAGESASRAKLQEYEYLGDGFGIYRPILRWTVADVFEAHRIAGIKPNPLYLQGERRVGCFPCINERKDGLANKVRRFPEHLERIAEWERIVGMASKAGIATFFYGKDIATAATWAQTLRGGKIVDPLFYEEDISGCSSSYGLCDLGDS